MGAYPKLGRGGRFVPRSAWCPAPVAWAGCNGYAGRSRPSAPANRLFSAAAFIIVMSGRPHPRRLLQVAFARSANDGRRNHRTRNSSDIRRRSARWPGHLPRSKRPTPIRSACAGSPRAFLASDWRPVAAAADVHHAACWPVSGRAVRLRNNVQRAEGRLRCGDRHARTLSSRGSTIWSWPRGWWPSASSQRGEHHAAVRHKFRWPGLRRDRRQGRLHHHELSRRRGRRQQSRSGSAIAARPRPPSSAPMPMTDIAVLKIDLTI